MKSSHYDASNTCAEAREWRKSRYCGANGTCAEVKQWRKACGANTGCVEACGATSGCVETAEADTLVELRDSKFPDMQHFFFTRQAFGSLLEQIKNG